MLYWVQHKSFVIYWQPFADYNGGKISILFSGNNSGNAFKWFCLQNKKFLIRRHSQFLVLQQKSKQTKLMEELRRTNNSWSFEVSFRLWISRKNFRSRLLLSDYGFSVCCKMLIYKNGFLTTTTRNSTDSWCKKKQKLPRKSPHKTVMEMTSEVGKNGVFMEIQSLPTHFWIFLWNSNRTRTKNQTYSKKINFTSLHRKNDEIKFTKKIQLNSFDYKFSVNFT